MRKSRIVLAVLMVTAGCRHSAPAPPAAPATGAPPAFMLGNFVDDYGGTYSISRAAWTHGARNRYHVVAWNPAQQYVILRNDSANASDGGRWSRIDWMEFPGDERWPWAFCFSAYNAPSADSAAATRIARRETPRTGCGGHPFSRMRNVAQPPMPDR